MIMKNFKRRGSDSTHEKGTFVMGGFSKTSLSIVVAMCKTQPIFQGAVGIVFMTPFLCQVYFLEWLDLLITKSFIRRGAKTINIPP